MSFGDDTVDGDLTRPDALSSLILKVRDVTHSAMKRDDALEPAKQNPYAPPQSKLEEFGEPEEPRARPFAVSLILGMNIVFNVFMALSILLVSIDTSSLGFELKYIVASASLFDFLAQGLWILGIALLYMLLTDAIVVMGVALVLDLSTPLWSEVNMTWFFVMNAISIAIVVYATQLQKRGVLRSSRLLTELSRIDPEPY